MTWLALYCPLCRNVVGELRDVPGAEYRGRCRSRHCRDKPRVCWGVTDVHTVVVLSMDVDRRSPAAVA